MKSVTISFEGTEGQKIACEAGMKFVFDASVGEAEFTRDGNDLVVSKGGAAIILSGFYDVYNKDEQPSFEIDGVDIASADFFEAMNATDLQPAAGPGGQSAASAAAGGGRYSAYSDMALLDGINKLGPLDIGFNGEPPIHEYLASAGRRRGDDEVEDEPTPEPTREAEVSITTEDTHEGDGSTVTFVVKLSTLPDGPATVQLLIDGKTYDVAIDPKTGIGRLTIDTGNLEDPYVDPSSITATVIGVTGGGYDNVTGTGTTATAHVKDTITPVTISITADDTVEGTASVVYTLTLSAEPHGDATAVVTVGGKDYTVIFKDGSTKAILTIDNPNEEDAFVDPSFLRATIKSATGGNFERIDISENESYAIANIKDTPNTTNVVISSSPIIDGKFTVTASLESPDGLNIVPNKDITFNLVYGDDELGVITIKAGETFAEQEFKYILGSSTGKLIRVTSVEGYNDANNDGEISLNESSLGLYEGLNYTYSQNCILKPAPINLIFTADAGDNMSFTLDGGVEKSIAGAQMFYDIIKKTIDDNPDAEINVVFIPFANRAYMPNTPSYMWGVGQDGKGVFRGVTTETLGKYVENPLYDYKDQDFTDETLMYQLQRFYYMRDHASKVSYKSGSSYTGTKIYDGDPNKGGHLVDLVRNDSVEIIHADTEYESDIYYNEKGQLVKLSGNNVSVINSDIDNFLANWEFFHCDYRLPGVASKNDSVNKFLNLDYPGSADKALVRNNHQNAMSVVKEWIEKYSDDMQDNRVIIETGFIANSCNPISTGSMIANQKISVLVNKSQFDNDGVYVDDMGLKYIRSGDIVKVETNVGKYELSATSSTGEAFQGSIELSYKDILSWDIIDDKIYNIGADKYKAVYAANAIYLYKYIDGQFVQNNITETNLEGNYRFVIMQGQMNSSCFLQNENSVQLAEVWDAVADEIKDVYDVATSVKFIGLYGKGDSHDMALFQFVDYLLRAEALQPEDVASFGKYIANEKTDWSSNLQSVEDFANRFEQIMTDRIGDDRLLDVANNADPEHPNDINGTEYINVNHPGSDIIRGNAASNHIDGKTGSDVLLGMDGDDILDGGDGNYRDVLFGGNGNDYLDGGDSRDSLYGGAGNDIILYDRDDFVIDGGKDIDILLSNDVSSLDSLLKNNDISNGPLVSNVEILVNGTEIDKITSLADLKDKGVTVGSSTVELSSDWHVKDKDNPHIFTNDAGLTLETTLDVVENDESHDVSADATILAMQITHG